MLGMRARTNQDQQFWHIVDDLHWRLDDGSGGPPPPAEPEFDHGGGGGGGVWPRWATHLIAFLLGGLTWGALLIAPPLVPLFALTALISFVAFAYRRRWH